MRARLLSLIITNLIINTANAHYFTDVSIHDVGYDLNYFTIPANVGENTGAFHDNGSTAYHVAASSGNSAYVDLSINGTLLSDNVTWATSNPGIGIQYRFDSPADFVPSWSETAPNYRLDMPHSPGVTTSYFHLRYRLVRLLEKIPAGKITSLPQVTLRVHNPEGEGTSLISGVILSNITSNLKVTACGIDAPSEIKLPTLYGNTIQNGALNVTEAPTVTLTNCPGAVDGISYNFSAVYGTHNAANGVLNTESGDGYAQNVYIQVQNTDGTPHIVNGSIPLSDYNGSGDYKIPDFKVAYFVDDAESVTAGNVKSAIELKVTYN
ncbi:fimbrial protein [Enterobacter quasiroggenkampii]|uniref:fimbrial protein n=1 Tax=Enterobacter quasiroggenkampii TaxID=2497436 RepID=UPI0021D38EEF|nr:fimbrial protein [Enterobacter quasiroggenkampii]